MKVVRYSVQEHPDGYAVWELCPEEYAGRSCRFALWCQCVHSSGGPLTAVVKVVPTLAQALAVCETMEAATGGVKEVSYGVRIVGPADVAAGDVSY